MIKTYNYEMGKVDENGEFTISIKTSQGTLKFPRGRGMKYKVVINDWQHSQAISSAVAELITLERINKDIHDIGIHFFLQEITVNPKTSFTITG